MAHNEVGQEVPIAIEEAARQRACLGGVQYVYRDRDYGGRCPVASIGCRRATRFRGSNYESSKVSLGDGWVAFKSPSYMAPIILNGDAEKPDETLDALLRLTDSDAYAPQEDPWISQATADVDEAINALIDEFAELPYLHRVEHSLHVRLCALLCERPKRVVGGHFPVGDNLAVTQLVHKEWPETFARPEKGKRRGNFDVVVLSPKLLATCQTIEDFREGRLAAPFVVEIGLDYDVHHLANDARKLINSRPHRGYLVHFVRRKPRDPDSEQIISRLERRTTGICTAYVCIDDEGRTWQKRVTERDITEKIRENQRGA
jgi:hypothetical protein